MGWTGGYVLLALLIAPYLRKYGKYTVPDFIGERYYSNTARVVSVICLILCSVTYVIGQMKGVGVAFSRFLETDYETGLGIGMFIVFFYAVLGGMKGITYTQIAQYVVLITAYTIPAIFISLQLTGNPLPQLGLGSTLAGGDIYLLDKLDMILVDLGFEEYTTTLRGSKLNMMAFTASSWLGLPVCRTSSFVSLRCPAWRLAIRWVGAGGHRYSLYNGTGDFGDGAAEYCRHHAAV